MFAAIRVLGAESTGGVRSPQAIRRALVELARECSPKVERHGEDVVVVDASGLERLIGEAAAIGAEVQRQAEARGLRVMVALAATRVTALLFVHVTAVPPERVPPCLVVPVGAESAQLAGLPLTVLEALSWLWARASPPGRTTAPGSARARARRGRSGHYRLAPAPSIASTAEESRGEESTTEEATTKESTAEEASRPGGALTVHVATAEGLVPSREPDARRSGTAPGPLASVLDPAAVQAAVATLRRWGVRTLGQLAALPPDEVFARLGQAGVTLQRVARGEDDRPLVADVPAPDFTAGMSLEWPLEGLEPLSFVLGRVLDEICRRLEQHDRGAVRLTIRLRLVTKAVHERVIELPAPMRDARVLRTLALLDLESHPPPAGIDVIEAHVDPAPGAIVQHSLLVRAVPAPEQLSTLLARLTSIMGEDRCGAPMLVDSYRPGAFAMQVFHPTDGVVDAESVTTVSGASAVLRRCRHPLVVTVDVAQGRPHRVWAQGEGMRGGIVCEWAGPWRSSGDWWADALASTTTDRRDALTPWDCEEWDVELSDGGAYRLSHARRSGQWVIAGVLD